MAKQTFTVGQVLTADQMTSLQQTAMGGGSATAKTASYTLVAADAGTTIIMNSGSATTITVNTALFAAGDTVFVVNQGAGVCTITAGTATVSTAGSLAMGANETGQLYFLSTSAAIFSEYTQAAGSASGLTLISATACSAVSTQAITAFSATYENYRVIIVGDGTQDGFVSFKLRSGATDSSTAYYGYITRYFSGGTTQTTGVSNAGDFEITGGFTACSSEIEILRPFLAKRTSIFNQGVHFDTGNTRSVAQTNIGVHNAQTSYDGINVFWAFGSFTGTIYVYGYQKS